MTHSNQPQNTTILLTGATGYIGGRLLKELENLGYSVCCLTRRPEHLQPRISSSSRVIQGDVLDPDSLDNAFKGIDVAYYLVHSMGSKSDFEKEDRKAAVNFSTAAKNAGVKRIIYLGGLGNENGNLSPHLRSRIEVGRILRESGVPTVELKASIIIGSGSLSFEMIRNLVERLPIMVTPKWVRVSAQPIFVDDILRYLIQSIDIPLEKSRSYEVGGADVISYGGLMQEYARQRKLKRWMIPVPFLTPWLSSLWLNLITPLYARIGRKLIDSIKHSSAVSNHQALEKFDIKPLGVTEAMAKAIKKEEDYWNQTSWSDALSSVGPQKNWGGLRFGNRIIDHRSLSTKVSKIGAFAPIRRIGGDTGWYFANFLWRIRGFIDYLFGGVGLRRGRRDADQLRVGDGLDFWRVEALEDNTRLRLAAEMKLPGRAWLELEVKEKDGQTEVHQTAIFEPLGLFGQLYWYVLYPFHVLIFKGMLKNIVKAAERSK